MQSKVKTKPHTLNPSPFNIILLGDPAAGKATQAARIAKKYDMYDFDMGKELNILRSKNKAVDQALKSNTDKGHLSPTKIVRDILKQKISDIPKSQGIIFDGHPKMIGEAKLVASLLKKSGRSNPIFIYLHIPMDETTSRMTNRQGYFAGKFGKRADDSDAALKNRVRYYRAQVAQVLEFFGNKFGLAKINGIGTVKEVSERIDKEIKRHEQKFNKKT